MRIKSSLLKGILVTALCLAIYPVADRTVVYAATVSDLEKEKEEIERKKKEEEEKKKQEQQNLDNANSKASAIAGEMDDVEAEIEEIDDNIVETIASIEIIEEEISDKEAEIAVTTAEYEEAKANEEAQYERMKIRIRYMYEKGEYSYLQMLVESSGFSDMLSKAEYIEKLYEYDRKLLTEYQEAKDRTYALKERLEDEKSELDAALYELEEEKAYLDQILSEKEAEYDDYSSQLARAKQEASAYKANVEKRNAAIRDLQKQSDAKQSEINEAKRKEEEERLRREEEERRRSEESSSGSSESRPSRNYASANSFSGSKGQQIASYAQQFIGNPYVSGGTSLTEGADCSGFVMRVYKDFGYSLPRTSTSMRGVGTEVSYENAQPGDIVCYAGHVGLYIGNGQIVHASSARTGIKISNALYKSIITIRRIV